MGLTSPIIDRTKRNMSKKSFVLPTISGIVAFSSTLAMSTFLQLQMHVSTGTRPLLVPWAFGVATVGVASIASQYAAIHTYNIVRDSNLRKKYRGQSEFFINDKTFGLDLNNSHSLRVCAAGMIGFKILGGRFWAIAPSSYTNLGSFARFSIPANSSGYASSAQRRTIERIGRMAGCHTCGSRMLIDRSKSSSVNFIADHMPPNAAVKQMNERWFRRMVGRTKSQSFYPQCVKCSNKQGGILAAAVNKLNASSTPVFFRGRRPSINLMSAGGGRLAHNHGLRLRTSHISGGLIAGMTIYDASLSDINKGNSRRFREIFCDIEKVFQKLIEVFR